MEDGQALKPRFKLPSFKDVQQRGSEKSRLQSSFQQVGSANTAANAPQPSSSNAAVATRNDFPASDRSNGAVCASTAPTPSGFSAQHSIQWEPTAAPPVNALPAPSNASADPQQPETFHGGARVPEPAAPATAPLQPSNRAPATSTAYSSQIGYGNAILVNRNQQGNPVLKHVRNVNYRFADVVPDFQFNDQTAAIFLSLKFHRLKPQYMASRIKMLNRAFRAFLICMCDVEDPVNALAEVAQGAVDLNVTLVVAFSEAECGRYLELLKVYENKQADALRPQTDTDYVVRVAKVLTHVRAVNRTDSAIMGSDRRSLASIFQSTDNELSAVPGLGPAKVKRLFAAFDSPFYINQRKPEVPKSTAGHDGEGQPVQLSAKEAREWVATQQVRIEEGAETSDEEDR